MWISRVHYDELQKRAHDERIAAIGSHAELVAATVKLQSHISDIARLRSEMNWFKHRLNQVERERGQLIQAAIGVKIAVPEFVPTYERPDEALNEMPDLSTIGGDAREDPIGIGDMTPDYSMLPGYQRAKS